MRRDVLVTVLNAVSNSSRVPVSEAEVIAILETGDGPGHLVRALFGDCSYETLDRFGAAVGVPSSQIRGAYRVARERHAAANADMDQHS